MHPGVADLMRNNQCARACVAIVFREDRPALFIEHGLRTLQCRISWGKPREFQLKACDSAVDQVHRLHRRAALSDNRFVETSRFSAYDFEGVHALVVKR
jgi:hypothetical protein